MEEKGFPTDFLIFFRSSSKGKKVPRDRVLPSFCNHVKQSHSVVRHPEYQRICYSSRFRPILSITWKGEPARVLADGLERPDVGILVVLTQGMALLGVERGCDRAGAVALLEGPDCVDKTLMSADTCLDYA